MMAEVSDQAVAQGEALWKMTSGGITAIEASIIRSAETHDKAMSTRHKETQSNFSSVGESIATLATSVSKMADNLARLQSQCSSHGFQHQLRKSKSEASGPDSHRDDRVSTQSHEAGTSDRRRAEEQTGPLSPSTPATLASVNGRNFRQKTANAMYCCDAVSGIDEAFTDLLGPGLNRTVQCLYCWDLFEDANPRSLGKHLVEAHAFGQCDLEESYPTWNSFLNHLRWFHNAEYSQTEPPVKKRLFIAKRRHGYYEATKSTDLYPKVHQVDKTTEDICIETKLAMLLAEVQLYNSPTSSFKPRDRLELANGLRRLEERAFAEDTRDLVPMLCEAACLEEELIVQCDRTLPYNWSMFSLYEHFASGALGFGLERSSPGRTGRHQSRWLCIEPRHRRDTTTMLRQCKYCLGGTVYNSKGSALRHLKSNHPTVIDDGGTGSWIDTYPQPLSYRDVAPLANHTGSGSFAERFDLWMMGMFFESDYLRTLLRSGAVFDRGGPVRDSDSRRRPLQFSIPAHIQDVAWTLHFNDKFQSIAHFESYPEKSQCSQSERAVDGRESVGSDFNDFKLQTFLGLV